MDDEMKKDLVENAVGVNVDEQPPPYNLAPPPTDQHDQQLAPGFSHQPNVGVMHPGQFPGNPQIATVQAVTAQPTTVEVFATEECFAECVRFCWCRPIGWMAKGEIARARALYIAGDYEGARAAARCANAWSVAGMISGIILCVAVGVSLYFIFTNIDFY